MGATLRYFPDGDAAVYEGELNGGDRRDGLNSTTRWAYEKAGIYPKKELIGGRHPAQKAWRWSKIKRWLEEEEHLKKLPHDEYAKLMRERKRKVLATNDGLRRMEMKQTRNALERAKDRVRVFNSKLDELDKLGKAKG